MAATPTGRAVKTARGLDVVLTRSFPASIDDVWASITESERTAEWFGPWVGEAALGKDGTTELRFTHHLNEAGDSASTGPGWEYYLDKLIAAARDGAPQPEWDDYYPAQKGHYEESAAQLG